MTTPTRPKLFSRGEWPEAQRIAGYDLLALAECSVAHVRALLPPPPGSVSG